MIKKSILLAVVISFLTTTIYAADPIIGAQIGKSGKLAIFTMAGSAVGNPPIVVSTINSNPTIYRNGTLVSVGDPIYFPQTKDSPWVAYSLLCGGVKSLAIVDGGSNLSSIDNIKVNIDESNAGGTGLVLGTPVLKSGVTDYNIINSGLGYPLPPKVVFSDPGGGTGASGYAIVTSGRLANVIITNIGQNYSPQTKISFDTTGTSGSGAVGTVQIDNGGHLVGVNLSIFGSGYASGPAVTVAAPPLAWGAQGNIQARAIAIVNDSSTATPGSIRIIIPVLGGLPGCGSGYDPSKPPTVTVSAPSTGGTQAVVTPIISNYISSIPVQQQGNYASPPNVTVLDSASPSSFRSPVFKPLMTGAQPSDTFTYTAQASWLPSAPAVNNAAMSNWTGQNEGPTGGFPGFADKPKMRVGANHGPVPMAYWSHLQTWKNKLHGVGFGATAPGVLSVDEERVPISWTNPSKSVIQSLLVYGYGGNVVDGMGLPYRFGRHSLQYDDPFVNTIEATSTWIRSPDGQKVITPVMLSGPSSPIVIPPSNITGSNGVWNVSLNGLDLGTGWQGAAALIKTPSGIDSANVIVTNGVPTSVNMISADGYIPVVTLYGTKVSGTTVTQSFDITPTPINGPGTGPTSWSSQLYLGISQRSGRWNLGNPWLISPGNDPANLDRSKRFAVDDFVLNTLKSNGKGPACIRWMDATGSYAGPNNYVVSTDIIKGDRLSWNQTTNTRTVPFVAARAYNTDPNNTNYSWSSTKIYGLQSGFNQGVDATGRYINIPPGSNGAFFSIQPWWSIVELRSDIPHNIPTGTIVTFSGTGSIPLPDAPPIPSGAGGTLYTTGPNTAIFVYFCGGGANTSKWQTVSGNTEIPINWVGTINDVKSQVVPYEYAASASAQLGADYWLNIFNTSDDATRTIIHNVIQNIGPTSNLYIEYGNENWLDFASFYKAYGNLLNYTAPNTTILGVNYKPTMGVGSAILTANICDIIEKEWRSAGLDPSRLHRVYGGQYGNPARSQAQISAATKLGKRLDHICGAYYPGLPSDHPVLKALCPAGLLYNNAGSLPVDAINELFKWHLAYDQSVYGARAWTAEANNLKAYGQPTELCNVTFQSVGVALTNGQITNLTYNPNVTYVTPPTIRMIPPPSGINNTIASATANLDSTGKISSISITNPGSGYAGTPAVYILGGGNLPRGSYRFAYTFTDYQDRETTLGLSDVTAYGWAVSTAGGDVPYIPMPTLPPWAKSIKWYVQVNGQYTYYATTTASQANLNSVFSFNTAIPPGSNPPPTTNGCQDIVGPVPTYVMYEGSLQNLIPNGVPLQAQLLHDAVMHPSAADLLHGYYETCQRGGAVLMNYYCLYQGRNDPNSWALAFSPGQSPGDGTTNNFATIQGGEGADMHDHTYSNTSPYLKEFLDWGAVAN